MPKFELNRDVSNIRDRLTIALAQSSDITNIAETPLGADVLDSMLANSYQAKAAETIDHKLDTDNMLIEAVMGVAGEAGEVIDIVKKMCFQGHELDETHLVRELGDVLWYVAEAATALGINLSDIMYANLEKIGARYGDRFDPQASINRKEDDI